MTHGQARDASAEVADCGRDRAIGWSAGCRGHRRRATRRLRSHRWAGERLAAAAAAAAGGGPAPSPRGCVAARRMRTRHEPCRTSISPRSLTPRRATSGGSSSSATRASWARLPSPSPAPSWPLHLDHVTHRSDLLVERRLAGAVRAGPALDGPRATGARRRCSARLIVATRRPGRRQQLPEAVADTLAGERGGRSGRPTTWTVPIRRYRR